MVSTMIPNAIKYVGLDTHKKFSVGCIKDNDGNILYERKFRNEPHEIDLFLAHVPQDSKIALESSSCWQYIYDYLVDKGYNVVLSNPVKTRLIGESNKKTDFEDARKLADLLRMNALPQSYAAPRDVRDQRQITRHRATLGRIGKGIQNRVYAILRRHGNHSEFDDMYAKSALQYLESLDLPMIDRLELDQFIEMLRNIKGKMYVAEERITEMSTDLPGARILQTHPGISYYSSLTITGEIGDIHRFPSAKQLVSFGGLNPTVHQSGERCYLGRISKQGSKNLRWMLIQCANVAARHDPKLKSYYLKKKLGKGHNKAIVAVARKMLTNIYVMLKYQKSYHALRINKKAS